MCLCGIDGESTIARVQQEGRFLHGVRREKGREGVALELHVVKIYTKCFSGI